MRGNSFLYCYWYYSCTAGHEGRVDSCPGLYRRNIAQDLGRSVDRHQNAREGRRNIGRCLRRDLLQSKCDSVEPCKGVLELVGNLLVRLKLVNEWSAAVCPSVLYSSTPRNQHMSWTGMAAIAVVLQA